MIRFHFEGGAELAKALDQLSVGVSKRVMREALGDGGELIRAHAARIAPRAPGAPDIADHIGISTLRAKEGEISAIKIGPVKGFAYGLPLEIGTRKMPAQPFMRPAFDAQVEPALGAIGRALWLELAARGVHRTRTVSASLGVDAFQEFSEAYQR